MKNATDWIPKPSRFAPRELWLKILAVAVCYFAAGEVSISLSATSGIVTVVVFMAEGVSLAATILWGTRVWPGIFLGQIVLALFHGLSWPTALAIAAINSGEAVLGAVLFARLGLHKAYDRIRDVALLLGLIAFVLQPISATFGNLILLLDGKLNAAGYVNSWSVWWLGNVIGQVVVTPLLLSLHAALHNTRQDMRIALRKAWQPLLLILAIFAVMMAAPKFQGANIGIAMIPPLMVLLAARHGMSAATLGTALFMLLNLYYAHFDIKLFAGAISGGFVDLDLFLLSLALVGQFVAALFAERQQAEMALAVSLERLNEAQRIANVGSWELDLHSNRLEWSDEIYRIFEIDSSRFAASYESFLNAIHPEDRDMVDRAYQESLTNRTPYRLIHRLRFPDGRIKHVQESCETVYAGDGTPLRSRGTVLDITAIKRAEEKLHLYAKVFQSSGDAIIVTDSDNNIVDVNPEFTQLTGYTIDEVKGRNPRMLASGLTPPETYPVLWRTLLDTGIWQGELWDRRKDGSVYPKWATITAIRNSYDVIVNYMVTFVDISERKAAEERMHRLAHHDTLTGLSNRLGLEYRLEQAMLAARRENRNVAAMFIDMDRFKSINDTLGHHVGDLLLAEIAARLQSCARASDIVARLGGDEFVVILTHVMDGPAAALVAEKIVERLSHPYLLEGREVKSSPSLGVSLYPDFGADADALLKQADMAMYRAKKAGRGCFRMFSEDMLEARG